MVPAQGPVLDAALIAQDVCKTISVPFCVIGGVALQRWGEPRFTADADLSILVEPGREEEVAAAILSHLPSRIEDAAAFARRTRVLLLRSDRGVGIDMVLAGLPFEARVINRSSEWTIDHQTSLNTCSAEDLLVMKAFAGRDKDWADVTSVLERQGGKLDLTQVIAELEPLAQAKEEPDIVIQLKRRIARHIDPSNPSD